VPLPRPLAARSAFDDRLVGGFRALVAPAQGAVGADAASAAGATGVGVDAASRACAHSSGAFDTIDWALVAAAHGGHTACLALLLRCPGASVHAQNGGGFSLLQLAAQRRHYGCLQLLIDAGAAVAAVASESEGGGEAAAGPTAAPVVGTSRTPPALPPLPYAALELSAPEIAADLRDAQRLGLSGRGGALDALTLGECSFMYRYILRESCSHFDSPPLTYLTIPPAATSGCAASVEILLRWFAGGAHRAALRRARAARSAQQITAGGEGGVNIVDDTPVARALPHFRDALAAAASNGHAQCLHLLLAIGGASPDSQNALNQPVLFAAAANGHFCAVEVLLRAGAAPSARNAQRATALHAVASFAHRSASCAQRARAAERAAACASALIARGADVHAFSGVFVAGGATPLHAASKAGAARVLDVLLASGADANALTKGGRLAALTLAVQRGHCECVGALIAGGARLALRDRAGNNALHIAAHRADVATLRIVVRTRAPGAPPSLGDAPVGATAEVEAEALTMSALASQPNASRDTPLHLAAWSGASSCLRVLLRAIGGAFDARGGAAGRGEGGDGAPAAAARCARRIALENEAGGTALHVACSRGSAACVAALLDAGASPFAPLFEQRLSPSALAVVQRRVACVQALSDNGVFGATWLDCDAARVGALVLAAAACGSAEILRRLLLRRHARRAPRLAVESEGHGEAASSARALPREVVEAATENGCTALHLAAYGGHVECCEVLLRDAGANPHAPNRAGATALHAAVCSQKASVRVVELLVDWGADVDAATDFGATPLYFAVLAVDEACVRLLLRCGATARVGTAQCAAALGVRLARSPASERICAALQRGAEYWRAEGRSATASTPLAAAQRRRSDALCAATLAADPVRRTLLALLSPIGNGNGECVFVRDSEVRAALGSSARYTRALALLGQMQRRGAVLVLERAMSNGGREVEYVLASEATHAAIMRLNVQHACAKLSVEDAASVRQQLVERDARMLQEQSQLRAQRESGYFAVPGSSSASEAGAGAAVEGVAGGAARAAAVEGGAAASGRGTEERRKKSAAARAAQPGKKRKTASEVAKAAAERTDDEAFAAAVLLRIVRADLQDAFVGARPGPLATIDTVRIWHDDAARHGGVVRPLAKHEAWEAAWALGRGIPRRTLPCAALGTGGTAKSGEHKDRAAADDKQGFSPFRCAPPRVEETRAAFFAECALGRGAPRRAARVALAAAAPRPRARGLPEIAWLLPREIESFVVREFYCAGWECDAWRQRVRACGAKTLVALRAASDDDLVTRCGWRREWVDAMRARVTAAFAASKGAQAAAAVMQRRASQQYKMKEMRGVAAKFDDVKASAKAKASALLGASTGGAAAAEGRAARHAARRALAAASAAVEGKPHFARAKEERETFSAAKVFSQALAVASPAGRALSSPPPPPQSQSHSQPQLQSQSQSQSQSKAKLKAKSTQKPHGAHAASSSVALDAVEIELPAAIANAIAKHEKGREKGREWESAALRAFAKAMAGASPPSSPLPSPSAAAVATSSAGVSPSPSPSTAPLPPQRSAGDLKLAKSLWLRLSDAQRRELIERTKQSVGGGAIATTELRRRINERAASAAAAATVPTDASESPAAAPGAQTVASARASARAFAAGAPPAASPPLRVKERRRKKSSVGGGVSSALTDALTSMAEVEFEQHLSSFTAMLGGGGGFDSDEGAST
jgi:ankyrin repeat protein